MLKKIENRVMGGGPPGVNHTVFFVHASDTKHTGSRVGRNF